MQMSTQVHCVCGSVTNINIECGFQIDNLTEQAEKRLSKLITTCCSTFASKGRLADKSLAPRAGLATPMQAICTCDDAICFLHLLAAQHQMAQPLTIASQPLQLL